MRGKAGPGLWLAAAVLGHLVISLAHGGAHARAHVALSRIGGLFVLTVILAGPLVGLALAWPARRLGAWIVALTLGASLVFGVVNHFVRISPDHFSQVDAVWRPAFTITAGLLAITELLGFGLAIRIARQRSI